MDSVFDIKRSELDFERAQKNDKSIQRLYKFGIALSSKEKFPIDELEFVLRGNTSCHDIL